MGRVRTNTVKKASRKLIELYYNWLTHDFDTNKRFIHTVAEVRTKRLRNKIAGFTTYLIKRISHGPVRGISLIIQDGKSDRRVTSSLRSSSLKIEQIKVDKCSIEMLASTEMLATSPSKCDCPPPCNNRAQ